MYEQLKVPCLGIIENMSYYICLQCGHRDELFDHGGARKIAEELHVPFLGEIPLNARIRVHGDAGEPDKMFTDAGDDVGESVRQVVSNVAGQIGVRGSARPIAATSAE